MRDIVSDIISNKIDSNTYIIKKQSKVFPEIVHLNIIEDFHCYEELSNSSVSSSFEQFKKEQNKIVLNKIFANKIKRKYFKLKIKTNRKNEGDGSINSRKIKISSN